MNQTVASCWCNAPIARRPGPGRPAQFCSRAHYRSLHPAYRRRYRSEARADARAHRMPPRREPVTSIPDSWCVGQLTRAVYQQALTDRDTAWLTTRDAQGLWGDILDVLREATVTGMD